MPGSRKVEGKTAWIIGTGAALVPQIMSDSLKIKNCRTTNNDQVAHLAGGGVSVNEDNAVSLSDELSNPATVIVH